MNLLHKFWLIVLVYAFALTVNLLLSIGCLLTYYESLESAFAWSDFSADHAHLNGNGPTDGGPVVLPPPPSGGQYEVARAGTVDRRIFLILIINSLSAIALGLILLTLVRHWILRPVALLRKAARRYARGEWSYRVPVQSHDEFALLSNRVNLMAASLSQLQAERLEQERISACQQAVTCVIHNIRSPFTGIRWLAEAATMQPNRDAVSLERQKTIMSIVDNLLNGMNRFRESLRMGLPGTPSVPLRSAVTTVLEPMFREYEEKGIELLFQLPSDSVAVYLSRTQLSAILRTLLGDVLLTGRTGDALTLSTREKPSEKEYQELILEYRSHPSATGQMMKGFLWKEPTLTPVADIITQFGGRIDRYDVGDHRIRLVLTLPSGGVNPDG